MKNNEQARIIIEEWNKATDIDEEVRWKHPSDQLGFWGYVLPKYREHINVLPDYYRCNGSYGQFIRHFMLWSDDDRVQAMRSIYNRLIHSTIGLRTMGNQMLDIPAVEIPIVWRCNKQCGYCAHFSPYMNNIPDISLGEVVEMCRTWSKKLNPKKVTIIGGEPTLHHELIQICEIVRDYWNAKVWLQTNGTRIGDLSEKDLQRLSENDIEVSCTQHYKEDTEWIQDMTIRLNAFGIKTHIFEYGYDNAWKKYYQVINSKPHVYNSDARKAFDCCYAKYCCATLRNNHFYHCSILAYSTKMVELGYLDDTQGRLQTYQPAKPDMTEKELKLWWDSDFWNPTCGVCPSEKTGVSLEEKAHHFDNRS